MTTYPDKRQNYMRKSEDCKQTQRKLKLFVSLTLMVLVKIILTTGIGFFDHMLQAIFSP